MDPRCALSPTHTTRRRPAPVPPHLMCRFLCERLARAHRLWSHPFLERCRIAPLSPVELRGLVTQMYKISQAFPRFLSTIARTCPDDQHRMQLAMCLWNELGRGDPEFSHSALLRGFARALGIDERSLSSTRTEPETQALIDSYLAMAEHRGFIGALGAACYASEGIVGPLNEQLRHAVTRSTSLPDKALVFFACHTRNAADAVPKLSQMLEYHVRTRRDARIAADAMLESLDARCHFFDGIMRIARNPRGR